MGGLSDEGPVVTMVETDDLSKYYADLAATARESSVREAAMKFVVAEEHIKEGQAHEDALRNANKALALFRDIRHRVGVADSLRLIIHAYRLKAEVVRGKESQVTIKQAEDLASEHVAVFKQLGDKRSEAAMLVALAEINMRNVASTRRKQAANAAIEAQVICKEDGDKKLEATAVLVLCHIYLQQNKGQAAVKASLEARALFVAAKDKLGETKAMHALGMARSSIGELGEAVAATKQAQALYQSLGLSRQSTLEKFDVAKLCLQEGDAEESLRVVAAVQEDIANAPADSWGVLPAVASSFEVQVLIAADRLQDATAVAQERLELCPRGMVDVHEHLWALKASARALLANGRIDNAVKTVQEALKVCEEDMAGDVKWETSLTFLAAEMFSQGGKPGEAATWAQKACERFRKGGDKLGEGKAMHLLGKEHMKKKDPIAALKVSRQGRTLASKSEQQSMEASMLLLAAEAHLLMGEEEEGMGSAQEAAHTYSQVSDMKGEMQACRLVAAIYRANEEFSEADQAARRAQGLARDQGDKLSEIELLKWQAHMHAEAGNTKAALRSAKDAVRVGKNQSQKIQAEGLLLVSQKYLHHLINEAQRQDEPQKLIIAKANLVLKPGAEAIAMARAIEDKELTCLALLIHGQVANQVFKYEEGLACHEESLTIALEIGDTPCEAASYCMGAEARYGLGRMDLAGELAGKAVPLAKKVGDVGVLERCKRFVSVSSGRGGGGGRRRRKKIGTKMVKRMVEKRVGGGGGSAALALSDVKVMSMAVLKELAEEEISFDDALMDAGMDSLSAVTFRDKLNKQTGLKLPGTLMFDHPTLATVADLIVESSISASGGGGGGEGRIEMVEEMVEVSEYEDVSDDDSDHRPRGRRRKIGTRKVTKKVQKMVGGGGGGGSTLAVADVKMMAMGVLKELAEEQISFDDPLMDAGMDSLSAVTFRDKLNKQTGLKLPGTLMFDHPTLSTVTDLIVETSAAAVGGDGGGAGTLQWVEEEVDESEYEDDDDDEDYGPIVPRATKAIAEPSAAIVVAPKGLDIGDVKGMAMNVLTDLSDGEAIAFDDPLMDSGLDSLAAVTFRNDLSKKTGIKLPGTLMFDHPTLLGVAEFIVQESVGAF